MDGLSETHLISKDAVEAVIVEGDQPLQANQLVVLELSSFEYGGLFLDFLLNCMGEVVVYVI